MALSKHLREEIKAIRPIKGSESTRWQQYHEIIKAKSPDAIQEALDELHRAVTKQLKL